jgi:hypothetical protein
MLIKVGTNEKVGGLGRWLMTGDLNLNLERDFADMVQKRKQIKLRVNKNIFAGFFILMQIFR